MPDRTPPATPTTPCPTCRASVPRGSDSHPFCSDRCKTIDLGRWFNESYKVSRPIERSDIEEEV
jgi:endogenous inhibitor of DNA gyrase (YacG/DUF329 family)